ncbi:hypothetical protein BDA96_07G082800 [Sorghum bicolor]|uniref:Uncharacterized protein n=2 Tax=Sorghum bicolor TaxID=4558 RepID=A0A921QM66_SORBI|nr:hypothetical protein BDA96_07G082800 [Sorghum bicolor]KXG24729.1 hypothetical protein SORBI_3007G078900 [Sorghum bicolor]
MSKSASRLWADVEGGGKSKSARCRGRRELEQIDCEVQRWRTCGIGKSGERRIVPKFILRCAL